MTFLTIIPFIAFLIILITILTKGKQQRGNKEAIKAGLESKILLTQELLERETTSKFALIFILPFFVMGAFVMISFIKTMSIENFTAGIFPIIFFGLFMCIPIAMYISSVKFSNRVKSGDYYFIKDNLRDKVRRRSDDSTNYYLFFNQIQKRIKTSSTVFYDSEIGDEFYILVVGKRFKAYQTKYYELEDESKLQTYFPE